MDQPFFKNLIFGMLAIFSSTFLHAQRLPEKGSLGIYPKPYQGEENALEGRPMIDRVIPSSAAHKANCKPGDVITSMDGQEVNNVKELLKALESKFAGDTLNIKLWREGELQEIPVCLGSFHPPIPRGSKYSKLSFAFENGLQRAILQSPKGKGPFPVVYLIQGYTCQSIDNTSPLNPYQRISNLLVEAGFAVYRIEKLGVGESKVPGKVCAECGFDLENQLFKQGFDHLLSLKSENLDLGQIYIWGHSLGASHVPLLMKVPKIAMNTNKIVVSGLVLRSWFQYIDRMQREQNQIMGLDSLSANTQADLLYPIGEQFFLNKKSPKEIIKLDPTYEFGLAYAYNWNGDEQFFLRHYSFWQELNDQNIKQYWQKVKVPVLAVYGESDLEAINQNDAKELVELLQAEGVEAQFLLAEKTDHSFTRVDSKLDSWNIRFSENYAQYLSQNFSEQAVQEIINWIKK